MRETWNWTWGEIVRNFCYPQKFFLSSVAPVVCSNNVGEGHRITRTPLRPRLDAHYLSKFIQPFLWKLPKEVTPQTSIMRPYWSAGSENGCEARNSESRSGLESGTPGWECPPGLMPAGARCGNSGGQSQRPTALSRGQSRKERQGSKVISHRLLGGQGAEVQAGEMLTS